ncbi:MAG TPA: hypothetical protein VEX67_10250 [Solirubrobacteraceae bacterium]|nr:hypothetical protein [Solirubrobacteraceae bacterium]
MDLEAYERRFRRAGLPLLIEGWNASEDVFTRAAPLLSLVFVGEVLGALDRDWSLWANLGAAAGGLAILLSGFGLLNLVRGRRFFELPHRVGRLELAIFVILPALLPLVFSGQVVSAIVTAAANLALLALVYLVIGFGLVFIVRWAARQLPEGLTASLSVLTRAVPLLLVFSLVLFINTEMWQVFSLMPRAYLVAVAGLLALVGGAFLVGRLPREVVRLQGDGPPLNAHQRVNVGLVMFVSQGLQVLVVSLAMAAFFVVFGALTIGPEVRESWIGTSGTGIGPSFELLGGRLTITEELLRVSGAIAAFGGVYYAIAVLTDSTYREEFLDDIVGELRETFALRAEYLALRDSSRRT